MMTMRFFAIGSWTEGMLHFEKLKNFIVSYETASIAGSVYRLPVGFPVYLDHGTDEVMGQLIELKLDQTLIGLMDSFHGVHFVDAAKGLHSRIQKTVKKMSGQIEQAQVYIFNPKKLSKKAELIPDGLWQDSLTKNPPVTTQLTDKQKTYVLKLGAVKGRDIVPINDLSLYRELMKLELIVDKGRRLALSSLGKEVYNHLV
ncbi:MAG: gamma-glutamylcyclotransferase [Pseudobdellovibrio sp.]